MGPEVSLSLSWLREEKAACRLCVPKLTLPARLPGRGYPARQPLLGTALARSALPQIPACALLGGPAALLPPTTAP